MLKKAYQSLPTAIVSYDYKDIISGEGIVEFDCFLTNDTTDGFQGRIASGEYLVAYSNSETDGTILSGGVGVTFKSNVFNKQMVIRGICNIHTTFRLWSGGGTTGIYYILTLYHNTTQLATLTTPSMGNLGAAATAVQEINMGLSITETIFKVGDYFQLKVQPMEATGSYNYKIQADPTSRSKTASAPYPAIDSTVNPTRLTIQLPTKLDI